MLALILLIIFGLGMAFFATQNTGVVHIVVANYFFTGIPMYVIVVVSLLLGVFISWLISIVDALSSTFTIHGKNAELKKAHEIIDQQQHEISELQKEKLQKDGVSEKSKQPEEEAAPAFLQRIKHSFV